MRIGEREVSCLDKLFASKKTSSRIKMVGATVTLLNQDKIPELERLNVTENGITQLSGVEVTSVRNYKRRLSRFGSYVGSFADEDFDPVKEEPYGWLVVLAVFMIHVIVDGVTYSFGALYDELLHYYKDSQAATSMTMSALVGITYGCGPLASYLCEKFGLRSVALLGGLLACAGCLLSLITTTVTELVFTYGVLTGLGFGFMYLPAMVSVATWFEEHRSMAISIAVCGSGVGTLVFPPLTTFLLDYYSLSGCFLILAGIIVNGCVFAALLRAPPRNRRPRREPRKPLFLRAESLTVSISLPVGRIRKWVSEVDWKLFTNWKFCIYCLSSFLGGVSCYVPYMYLMKRAEEELLGISALDASWLISVVGITSIAGRITSGILSQYQITQNLVLYSLSCLISGVSTSLSIFCYTYDGFAVYAAVFGYTGGIIVALQSIVLTDIVGVERLSNAFGILLFVQGASVFVGPPAAGWILDRSTITNSLSAYHLCFVIFGALSSISGLVLLLIPLVNMVLRTSRRISQVLVTA